MVAGVVILAILVAVEEEGVVVRREDVDLRGVVTDVELLVVAAEVTLEAAVV